MTYQQQLQTPQWTAKRLQIFKRDKYKCRICDSKKHIQVHHLLYINGKSAWQYSSKLLLTVCRICHTNIHKNIPTIIVSGDNLTFKINK